MTITIKSDLGPGGRRYQTRLKWPVISTSPFYLIEIEETTESIAIRMDLGPENNKNQT
jgi:hypothetical protein